MVSIGQGLCALLADCCSVDHKVTLVLVRLLVWAMTLIARRDNREQKYYTQYGTASVLSQNVRFILRLLAGWSRQTSDCYLQYVCSARAQKAWKDALTPLRPSEWSSTGSVPRLECTSCGTRSKVVMVSYCETANRKGRKWQ